MLFCVVMVSFRLFSCALFFLKCFIWGGVLLFGCGLLLCVLLCCSCCVDYGVLCLFGFKMLLRFVLCLMCVVLVWVVCCVVLRVVCFDCFLGGGCLGVCVCFWSVQCYVCCFV